MSVTISLGSDSPNISKHRDSILAMRLRELCDYDRFFRAEAPEPSLRVCSHGLSGQPSNWKFLAKGQPATYDYYCVLPTEVVFDQGDHGDWWRVRRDAMLTWRVLNEWGVSYIAALSAGKGIHTHVYLRPFFEPSSLAESVRLLFAQAVLDRANYLLHGWDILVPKEDEVEADPLFYSPARDSRVIREFGARSHGGKSAHRKTLWMVGPAPIRVLPDSRDAAYEQAGLRFPSELPISRSPPAVWNAEVRAALGGVCPVRDECYTEVAGCDRCPLTA